MDLFIVMIDWQIVLKRSPLTKALTVTHYRTETTTVSWLETVTESVVVLRQQACPHHHNPAVADDESVKSVLHKVSNVLAWVFLFITRGHYLRWPQVKGKRYKARCYVLLQKFTTIIHYFQTADFSACRAQTHFSCLETKSADKPVILPGSKLCWEQSTWYGHEYILLIIGWVFGCNQNSCNCVDADLDHQFWNVITSWAC